MQPGGRRRGHSWVARGGRIVALLTVQLLVVFIVVELASRWLDPLGISFYPESAAYFDTLIREEPIGYRNAPGLEGEFWGAPVSINSLGMRDREVDARPSDHESRVLLLGDSVPFGLGVSYEDSIPHRLQQLLSESAEPPRHFRTLNFGVPSYNTEQELIQLRTLGMSLRPDLVILLFTTNDIEPKMWVLDKRRGLVVNMAQRSYAACLLHSLYRRARRSVGAGTPGIAVGNYEPSNPRWLAIENSMLEIHRLCREAGIPFVLFTVFVGADQPAMAMVQELGRRAGFPVVPLRPWDDPRWSDDDRSLYENSPSDSHPNAAGSRIYAQLIHEALLREGVVPGVSARVQPGR